jgi:hypothetical protein
MREFHPDANAEDPAATRKAARINAAYEILSSPSRRREYDKSLPRRTAVQNRHYAYVAEQDNWEDIIADQVPERRPAHVHEPAPTISPESIEVSMDELRAHARIRRSIVVSNPCACTLKGDVSTSEPWVWGPIGSFSVPPNGNAAFDIEIIARKVAFPGLSRVLFVTPSWTGVVPVRVTGYETVARRRTPPPADIAYVRQRSRKWTGSRRR